MPDQELIGLVGEKCPFCRVALDPQSCHVHGFVLVHEMIVSEPRGRFPEVQMLVSREKWPEEPGLFVYAEIKCGKCGMIRPAPHAKLPSPIRTRLTEALLCHQIGAVDAMALMCRSVVEATVSIVQSWEEKLEKEQGVKLDGRLVSGFSLAQKLTSLVANGVLGGVSERLAFAVKNLGNDAAHSASDGPGLGTNDLVEAGKLLFLTVGLAQAIYISEPSERECPDGSLHVVWVEKSRP